MGEEGKMKAVASVTFDDEFVVHDIKIIDGQNGLFIAMPSRKATDGEYRDIAHPINSATRDRIQGIILGKYEEVMAAEPEVEEKEETVQQESNHNAAILELHRQGASEIEIAKELGLGVGEVKLVLGLFREEEA